MVDAFDFSIGFMLCDWFVIGSVESKHRVLPRRVARGRTCKAHAESHSREQLSNRERVAAVRPFAAAATWQRATFSLNRHAVEDAIASEYDQLIASDGAH